ncbi:hypothetical protein KFL_007720020 [Klebsormidium nitens]|uniref:Uncharacterized protein n=1 Tax=Klebsormidium nitens TaxID=105231 RepID=A0A1Y1IKH4_KLENI|nr:hypothetical protein KFL_007720020 [Klebsormidium nitens]|eukprot:GAQ91360.1 hypothetical protein KFL_007720020 [Klebsormidium nitens]
MSATDQAPNLENAHPLVSHKAMQEAIAHAAIPLPPRKKRAQAGDPADPPAGFILNERGGLVKVEEAERATILRDPESGRNLECIVRRRIKSRQGREYLLLLAMDTPIEVLLADHSSQTYKEISDEDVVKLLPHATFALAKRKLHLVQSGFCLTVRGAVSYTEDDIVELDKGSGNGETDAAAEGVEICRFRLEDNEYLLYTPFEPVLFVAYRDGPQEELQLAVDHEFEDRAVHTLLQEERRFQEMVDEEEAFEDVLMRRKGSR